MRAGRQGDETRHEPSEVHVPQDDESKNLEFDLADFGIINLQTFGSQLASLSKWVEMESLIEKVTSNPRKILGLSLPTIDVDAKANLTLFDPAVEFTFTAADNLSKSKNSPWLGSALTGKVVATFNNSRHWIDV